MCNFEFSERITLIGRSCSYCWACCVLFRTLHPSCGPAGSSFGFFWAILLPLGGHFCTLWNLLASWMWLCFLPSFILHIKFLQTTVLSSCHFLLHCLLFNIIMIIIIWNLKVDINVIKGEMCNCKYLWWWGIYGWWRIS